MPSATNGVTPAMPPHVRPDGSQHGVLVVGASVGGTVAALALARAGIPVTVIDPHDQPWDKVCGEGLHPAGLRVLEPLLGSLASDGSPFRGFCFRTPEARDLTWHFPNAIHGLGVERTVLTRRLLEALRAEPLVELHLGTAVTALHRLAGGWHAETPIGGFDRRFVVGADGVTSRVRQWAGLARGDRYGRWGARRRYRLRTPIAERVTIEFMGTGEVYLTPLADQRLSVAVLGQKDWILTLRDPVEFDRLLHAARSLPDGATAEGGVAVLPHQGFRSSRPACEQVFLVGDAAMFLDPITGAGMTLAALGGAIAAEAIGSVVGGQPAATAEKWYARELEQALAPFVGLERFLGLVARSRLARRLALGGLRRLPWIISRLAKPTFEPRRRRASAPAGAR
ncbi:MAG: NAD(P)/FAD-dependent oxidoreductase [Planctomycetota bacterium]